MNIHAARQAQVAFNRFLFEASLLAGELDTVRSIANAEQRTFVVQRGHEAYGELLKRWESLHIPAEDAPLLQALLERIRTHLNISAIPAPRPVQSLAARSGGFRRL